MFTPIVPAAAVAPGCGGIKQCTAYKPDARETLITTTEMLVRWARRNPIVAGLSATLAVVLVLVVVGSSIAAWHFQRLAGDERTARKAANKAQEEEAIQRQR